MVRKLGRRSVLRAGYAAVVVILILSAVEAFRIQLNVSQQHMDIFYRYVDEEESLTLLRRNLWLEGIYVRDFFIKPSAEQAAVLSTQLESLHGEDSQALDHLERLSPQRTDFARLRKSLNDFWAVVNSVPTTMQHATPDQQFDFVQRVVVPRRGELTTALGGLSSAGERRVQDSAQQIIDTRHDAAQRLLLMLGLGVLICILVAMLSVRHAENLERRAELHYAEVEHARGEMQQLSARLLEVEEEGRRQLARELHDEIGQTLALLQIEISHAQGVVEGQPPAMRERLQRARLLAEKTVQTIRNISVLLRPALLDDLGLVPALQFQIEDFQRRSGIACEFVEENVAEQLSDGVKTCVYRVVQEALHNAEKHSGASKVQVSVKQLPQWLLVEIEDNGCGFQVNSKGMPSNTRGLGIVGMRERATITRGTLVIDTAPAHGTRIALRIPVGGSQLTPAPRDSHEVTA